MHPKEISKLFELLLSQNPNPRIELVHSNAFTLLIATVLSAQATDKQVNKITPPIFTEVTTPQDLVNKGEKWLFDKVRSINYNKTKASNLIKTSKMLVEKFQGQVPEDLNSMQTLPGVGRKSANVILNSAFNLPTIPVDTHVFRVSNRTGLTNEPNVLKTELALLKVIPKKFGKSAHHLLVLHGRYICKARNPKCKECVITNICKFNEKNL